MRLSYLITATLLGFTGLAAAGDSHGQPVAGTWSAISAQRDGKPDSTIVGHQLVFTGTRFEITKGNTLVYGGTYTVQPSKSPAQIDFHQEQGPALRGNWKGIYRIEGREMEIIDNADDVSKPRPTQFATAPQSGYVLVRFRAK